MLSSSTRLTDATAPSWRALPAVPRSYWLSPFEGLSSAPQGWWFKSNLRQQCQKWAWCVNGGEETYKSQGERGDQSPCWGRAWDAEGEGEFVRTQVGVCLWKAFPAAFLQCVSSWVPLLACCSCVVCELELLSESPERCSEAVFSGPSPLSPSWVWKGERERAGPGVTSMWWWFCW